MNKRIKTVWILSIVTMILIFCGQTYWLINQYEFTTSLKIEKLKNVCIKALEEEQMKRFNSHKKEKDANNDSRTVIKVNISQTETIRDDKLNVKTGLNYELNGKRKTVYLKDLEKAEGVDISYRYLASKQERLNKNTLDSLLSAAGYDTTRHFRFYRSDRYMKNPVYAVSGTFGNSLNVRYSSNPLLYEAVAFDIVIGPAATIRSMAWQLAGSALLIVVLAFCLMYQIKTIIIQKRIDRIRHEFMKNMIYEMKQPPATEPAESEAVKIGDTEFFYSFNELRHGSERVIITSRQAEILRLLAEHTDNLVSRKSILTEVWGDDSYANSMALNVQITYLRRALKPDSAVSIEAVIRKGYILKVGR